MEAASDVPHDYLQTMMLDYYRANVDISDQKAQEIETITRGQGQYLAGRKEKVYHSLQHRSNSETATHNKGLQFS